MFNFLKKPQKKLNTKETVDIIENIIYDNVKPLGFKKFGRTLHRFVCGDISQVINFQSGLPTLGNGGHMCVNIAIRVPECADKTFQPLEEKQKYYREFECNMRTRLGYIANGKDTWYDLKKDPTKTGRIIWEEIEKYVLPAFDLLNSRETILKHRRDYPQFDTLHGHMILLEEALIYGHLGNMEKMRSSFNAYYQKITDEYNETLKNGTKHYLDKGKSIIYMGQKTTAEKDGFVTIYGANDAHIKYIDELAKKLGIFQ